MHPLKDDIQRLAQAWMCGRTISRTRKSPPNFPLPDKGRRFFVLLVRDAKHQPGETKTKSENTYPTCVVAASIVGAFTDPREWILPDGQHLRAATLAQLTK